MWAENVINREIFIWHTTTMKRHSYTQESHIFATWLAFIFTSLRAQLVEYASRMLLLIYAIFPAFPFSVPFAKKSNDIQLSKKLWFLTCHRYATATTTINTNITPHYPRSAKTLLYTKCFTLLFSTSSLPHLFIHITFHFVYTLVFHILAK